VTAKRPAPTASRLPRSTVIALLAMLPAALAAATLGQGWRAANDDLLAEQQRIAAIKKENAELAGPQKLLTAKPFEACAAVTEGRVRLEWVAAAYPEGERMAFFDAARCADWRARELKSGKLALTHTSSLPGCNWSGEVVFVAAAWSVDTEDEQGAFSYSNVSLATYGTEIEGCFKVR
jgi:hypothetical protein